MLVAVVLTVPMMEKSCYHFTGGYSIIEGCLAFSVVGFSFHLERVMVHVVVELRVVRRDGEHKKAVSRKKRQGNPKRMILTSNVWPKTPLFCDILNLVTGLGQY